MKLKTLNIEVTDRCLNKCLFCSSDSYERAYTELPIEKIMSIMDQAKALGVQLITISGGEPLLHPYIIEMVEYAKQIGIPEVYIYTSGIVSHTDDNPNLIERIFLKLNHNNKVDKLIFDLPAIDYKTYREIVGVNEHFRHVMRSIAIARTIGMKSEINFVPTKINYHDIGKLVRYCDNVKIKINFLGFVPQGRGRENRKKLELSELQKIFLRRKLVWYKMLYPDIIRIGTPLQLKKNCDACTAGVNKLTINSDGEVSLCEAFKGMTWLPDADTIYNHSLKDIMDSSMRLSSEKHIKTTYLNNFCESCPVQEYYRLKEDQ